MFRKLSILPIILLFAACGVAPEAGQRSFDYPGIKRAAEAKKRNFNPGFVTSFHTALIYKIHDYGIRDSLLRIERLTVPAMKTVAGEVPERNARGPFRVTFLSDNNDTLYHYGMKNPLYVRVEDGPGKGLHKVKAGSFLVPMPAIKNITRIILEDPDGTYHESKLRIQ